MYIPIFFLKYEKHVKLVYAMVFNYRMLREYVQFLFHVEERKSDCRARILTPCT